MFGSMFGRQNAEAAPAAPTPAPAAPAPQPQQPQHTARNEPLNAAAQQPQGQPAQPTQPTQPAAPAPVTLNSIISRLSTQPQAQAANPNDPVQFAQDFIGSMMNAPEQSATPTAPRINAEALREAFGQVDLTSGLDLAQLTEALQGRGNGEVDAATLTQQALQNQGLNIITAIAPLMNQMVQRAMEQAVTDATSRTHHGLTSQSLVTEFLDAYPYARNPMMMNMVREFCNTIVAQNPTSIDRPAVFKAIDLAFQGMSKTIRPDVPQGQENLPRGAQTGFGDVFS